MSENSIFKTKQESAIHHYPLYLNGSVENQGDHGLEQARECIQFTAVKQPGVSFNKDFEDKIRIQYQVHRWLIHDYISHHLRISLIED